MGDDVVICRHLSSFSDIDVALSQRDLVIQLPLHGDGMNKIGTIPAFCQRRKLALYVLKYARSVVSVRREQQRSGCSDDVAQSIGG